MKQKYGKIALGVLVMLLVAITLFVIFSSSQAVPISGSTEEKLGSFTGPVGGTAQDDTVKASLDLAHTDLDSGLANQEDGLALLGQSTGKVVYVDNGASGTDDGSSLTNACPTTNDAIDECTANAGDVVLWAPGHTETLGTGADGVDIDKAGIKFKSMGKGLLRAKFDYDTATDEFVIGAAGDGTVIDGAWFHSNIDSTVKAVDIEAGCINWTIKNCLFDVETQDTDEFDDAIIVGDASDEGNIIDNEFYMAAGDAVSAIFLDHDADHMRIIGNEVHGDYSTACIFNDTAACEHILIKDNILFNGTDTAGLNTEPGIELVATTSGVICGNMIACDVAIPSLSIVAADCHLFNNTYNENEGVNGGQLIGTRAGQIYCSTMTATSTNDDLFDVDGGPILITSFTGVVTTQIGGVGNTVAIDLDADAGWIDSDFSTAVETNGDIVGTRYTFTDVAESVLVPVSDTTGNTNLMSDWYCGEGMIEQSASGATTGAIKWYMTWIPFDDGTTVTPQ